MHVMNIEIEKKQGLDLLMRLRRKFIMPLYEGAKNCG
jgi:hypothetical protein